ncbi:MAG TPA: phage terminase large subunit, partial [Planctomycetota bacterium]|nr:phage terminase large subunit [Planctomycetota bacterium]
MRTIHYNALPAQHRFLASKAQFAGLFGGIGSGKSHAGCFWALTKALSNPRCLGLIGANSYRQLQDATLRTFQQFLATYRVPHTFNATDLRFRLANGAEVLCRSMESYDSLRGIELGWFYLDELRDTRLEAWRVVQGRLRSQNVDAREGRVTSSPNGFNWIYDEFIRRPADPGNPEARRLYEAIFARTSDNKHLPSDYVAALVAGYDPLLAAQELDGRFINTTAGRIYHTFDRDTHVSAAAGLVPGEPILWALDFNVTPMTAVIAQWEPCGTAALGCESRGPRRMSTAGGGCAT